MILRTNWFPQAHNSVMHQNEPYKHTIIILPLSFADWTPTSQYKYGVASSHMGKLHSIYS